MSRPTIALVSRTPWLDEKFFGPLDVEVFPPLIAAPSLYPGFRTKVRSTFQTTFNWPGQKRLIDRIRASDLVIGSGGGYFFSHRRRFPGPMFFQNYLPLRIAAAFRKPVVLFPQSFGPLMSSAAGRLLKNLLNNRSVKKIYARETASLAYIKTLLPESREAKLDFCPDIALALRKDRSPDHPRRTLDLPRPVAALTVRSWDFPEVTRARDKKARQERYLGAVVKACGEFQERWKGSVAIVPQVRGPGVFENDEIPSKLIWAELKKRLPPGHLAYIPLPVDVSPWTLIDIFAQSDLVLATRFHSALFALLAGTPAVSLAYQPKSRATMAWLQLEEWSLDISTLRPEALLQLAERIIADGGGLRESIRSRIDMARTVIEERLGALAESFGGYSPA